jgi:hypothetical protein
LENKSCPDGRVGMSRRREVAGKGDRKGEYSAKTVYTCM